MDTLRAQLTMRLPIGRREDGPPLAYWDHWIVRLHASFVDKFQTTVFDRDILLNVTCIYRAFTIGRRIRVNSDFYDGYTYGLLDLARGAVGRCVRHDLALYVIDMRVLVPDPALDEAPLSFLRHYYAEPATPDFPDNDLSPDITISAPPSPSINAATELAEASAHDSGYESFDTMPSLRTVADSSDDDDDYSNSSEEPDSDSEEEALIAEGFVVDESDADDSDLDL
ncbi:hypothetical protein LXA43DRAFT_1101163 [Ganoderma leucocontextum]|nr:hypothetical protein LXA43DRAFT_1101163 [Ganoderma leucocontextum]